MSTLYVSVTEADKSIFILPPHPENSTAVVGKEASFLCHVQSSVEQQSPDIQVSHRQCF